MTLRILRLWNIISKSPLALNAAKNASSHVPRGAFIHVKNDATYPLVANARPALKRPATAD